MGIAVVGENVSTAWAMAFERLLGIGRDVVNLSVTIERPLEEDPTIPEILDRFTTEARLRNRDHGHGVELVSSVANTIFPRALYIPRLGRKAKTHLYEMSDLGREVTRRRNKRGTYFERLMAWPGAKEKINQLDNAIRRIRSARKRGRNTENALELEVGAPEDYLDISKCEESGDLSIYGAELDKGITRGFPCLSHISLSLMDGRLHMTALYRNHEFVRRAYGNYLGLGWLLGFVARESGCDVGELMCVSSHADPEIGKGAGFGIGALRTLADSCRAVTEHLFNDTGEIAREGCSSCGNER